MLENEKTERFACFRLQSSVQARTLKKALLAQKGVIAAAVNFSAEKAFVRFDTQEIRIENIIDIAKKYGVSFGLENETKQDLVSRRREAEFSAVKRNLILCSILIIPLLISMLFKWFDIDIEFINYLNKPIIQFILATPIVFLLSFRHILNMIKSPFSFSTLVVSGSFGAYFLSIYYGFFEKDIYRLYFDTAAIILIAVYFSKFFEMRTKIKISDELSEVISDTPTTATKICDDDKEELVDIEQVYENDILVVKNGERILADGVIISGASSISESALTGASIPANKKVGDNVFAGTLNIANPITISVNAVGEKTKLAGIVRSFEEIQMAKKEKILRIEKISQIFVAAVIALVLIVAVVNLFLHKSVTDIILVSIGILIVACPCALGLAFSTSAMVGSGTGAKYGILFRVGEAFEVLKKINAMIFGKSEVVSKRISVRKLQPMQEYNFKALQNILFSLSSNSRHPIARTINEYCISQGSTILTCVDFIETTGGIKATINGGVYAIGTYEYCEKLGGNIEPVKLQCSQSESNGELPYIVMKDGEVIAVILLSETINKTAEQAVFDLQNMDINVYMLTQDSQKMATRIAFSINIPQDKVFAELNPEEKVRAVNMVKETEKDVAMVGSGMSDALAMSEASIAISMGSIDSMTDISEVVIKNDDLQNIDRAVEISDKTTQITNQNIILACVFNVIGIPFAVLGVIDPAIASLSMVISSVCVVANSFRIENYKFD